MSAKTYTFTTLNDLLVAVPADRVEACMEELSVLVTKTAHLRVLVAAIAKETDPLAPAPEVKLPEPFEWIDDGKQQLKIKLGDVATLQFDPDGGLKGIVR